MDTPTYPATIIVGGPSQTTLFSGLPLARGLDSTALVSRQSGSIPATFYAADGTTPFDLSTATATAEVVPWNTDVTPIALTANIVSNVVTISWVKDTIDASWSTYAQDRDGAIALTVKVEETGTADFIQVYTRFNIVDGDFSGDAQTTPLIEFQYTWNDAIASEWTKYGRGTPVLMGNALSYLAAAGKNDWGTVIDKDLTTAPAGVDNAQYIIAGIGGAWSTGTIGDIARYSLADTVWYFKTPTDGNFVFVADENVSYRYDGAAWAIDQVTHAGQVTGSTVLSVDATAITDQSTVTATTGDLLLASRAGVLKKIDVVDFNGNMNTSVYDLSAVNEQLVGLTAVQSMTNKDVNGVTLATGGASTQYLSAAGTYNTPAGAGDMDTATYDPAAIGEQLVGLTAVQALTDKTVNGVNLQSTGLPTVFLSGTGSYGIPAGLGDMAASVYDAAAVNEQLVGLTASQNLTNKSVNTVTLVAGGSASQYLSQAGTYNTPAGAGDMLKAAYDAANINEQLVGLVATQLLTNKTINGVILASGGSPVLFLNQAGNYVTPAGGGDMTAAVYDAAAITEQVVGLTATQSLTNKTINGVVPVSGGSSTAFLNQFGTYTTPGSTGEANTASNVGGFTGLYKQKTGVDLEFKTVQSSDSSLTITSNTSDLDIVIDQAKIAAGTDNDQTGTTYTLVLADADNKTVWMNNAAANVLTVPTNASVAFSVGAKINVMMEGAGVTSITGDTGVTVNGVSAGSGAINNQYQGVTLTKRATNTWIVTGDVGTVA